MYARCGALAQAKEIFHLYKSRDVLTWTTLIAAFTEKGQGQDALNCFKQMLHEGLSPDAVTFTCILKACGSIRALDKGEEVHDEIAKKGLLRSNAILGNALVDMYAKCGALSKARKVLLELPGRNVICWTALIAGHVERGESVQALDCFEEMQQEGHVPNAVTLISILKACGNIKAANKGERIHDKIAKHGLLQQNPSLGTALVGMYVKCGALTKARQVLEELPIQNVISWSALITGYAENGDIEGAMVCFEQMQCNGVAPNAVTFACILKGCASIGAADKGQKFHKEIVDKQLLGMNIVLDTALIDMYAKCGVVTKARQVLNELPIRDAISWNALITGYTQCCEGSCALECFEEMQREGLSPNAGTFSCLLSVCSRVGLLEDAWIFFINMTSKYGMKPGLDHYTCMVDLYGRVGDLNKAVSVINQMPSCNIVVWCALLGACGKWGDVNIGRWAFEQAIQIDENDAAVFVLMGNVYATVGMLEEAACCRLKSEQRSDGVI